MTTISEQIQKELSLQGAPRVHAVSAAYVEAAALAVAHARRHLRLPEFTLVWCSKPSGHFGETWHYHDGSVEVLLNAGADLSPREVAKTLLHELRHAYDGEPLCSRYPGEAERNANEFATLVMTEAAQDFCRLSGRRPSGRR